MLHQTGLWNRTLILIPIATILKAAGYSSNATWSWAGAVVRPQCPLLAFSKENVKLWHAANHLLIKKPFQHLLKSPVVSWPLTL